MGRYTNYLIHPIYYSKLIFYYIFGNTIGRMIYPARMFKSKHFRLVGGYGWKWVFHCFWFQKVLGINRAVPWCVSYKATVGDFRNIEFDYDDLNNFMVGGGYYQALGAKIVIGKGTYIAPNVGLITANHDFADLDRHNEAKPILLGEKCWIGMNAVILPGIILGPNTIVAAGSIVTKSYSEGYCIIAGNPAKKIRDLKAE